jgi:signal transduction histidine kinase
MSATNASLAASPTVRELVSFVESAAAYAKENGKEKALKEFDNKTGQFVKDGLYIFAADLNGTTIATPFQHYTSLPLIFERANGFNPDFIGRNWLNKTDPNGVQFPENEIDALRTEASWFDYYIFRNPAHNNKPELKLGYEMKVDDDWYVGSGIYLSNISATLDQKERDDLVAYVNEALKFAKENGRQKALDVFNDPKGNFSRDNRYIFAAEYGGKCLAQPFSPELIGKNRLGDQDPNDVKIHRQASYAAKRGNGFYYLIYPDPSNNMTQTLKLLYATDVDGTWLLGSGIYAKGNEIS